MDGDEGGSVEDLSQEDNIFIDMCEELDRATEQHGKMNSAHEAYAVILEELDEFKAEVWKKSKDRDRKNMRKELIQVGAMCARAVIDLDLDPEG